MTRQLTALAAACLLVSIATTAQAQYDFPRIGLSASPDTYVDHVEAEIGETFTLYACVFGNGPGDPLEQPLKSMAWIVHLACCGAAMEVMDVAYNPDFQHEGEGPMTGVTTTTGGECIDQEGIWLATLQVRLDAPGPGDYIWAAGPYDWAVDCNDENPVFMDMPLIITVPGDTTPAADSSWGSLKADYR